MHDITYGARSIDAKQSTRQSLIAEIFTASPLAILLDALKSNLRHNG